MTGIYIYIISVHFDKFKSIVMSKVGITLSESFRGGNFMTWLSDMKNEKKKKRENKFENNSKVVLNLEQRGFRKVL